MLQQKNGGAAAGAPQELCDAHVKNYSTDSEPGKLAKLCAELVAKFPDKTFAELCHTIEIRHHVSMTSPERRAVLARAIEQAKASGPGAGGDELMAAAVEAPPLDHEVDDTDADLAGYDEEPEPEPEHEAEDSRSLAGPSSFTGPASGTRLHDIDEATRPPGKSASCQRTDQLTTERTDQNEQRAGARRKTIAMSENAEGAAANGAPHEAMSDAATSTASTGPSKAKNPPPGTDVHDAPSLAGGEPPAETPASGQKRPGTDDQGPKQEHAGANGGGDAIQRAFENAREPVPRPSATPLALELARKLWGEPTAQKGNEYQFGAKTINLRAGMWFDFESSSGGGVLDLIRLATDTADAGADSDGKAHEGESAGARTADAEAGASASAKKPRPVVMGADAYYGFAGKLVHTISEHSEADPVAILIQFLVCFGNMVGRNRYYLVESDRHYPNLYVALTGTSSVGRKGISLGRIKAIASVVDTDFVKKNMRGGLSSGEGLIHAVRDPATKWDAEKQIEIEVDHGVEDKRLLIVEPEFASVLSVMERSGNTISPLLRNGWDHGLLGTLTRASPLTATDAHLSAIFHITKDELKARLTRTDMANGFANRILFVHIQREKELPFGGDLEDSVVLHLGEQLQNIVDVAAGNNVVITGCAPPPERVTMTDAARTEWAGVYSKLSAGRPGLLGAVTSRAAPQALRLALVYALLDKADQIDVHHLKAGLAVWRYCEASAARIFGDALGDDVADALLRAIRSAGAAGIARTAFHGLLGRHATRGHISAALALLLEHGLVRVETKTTGGRPAETWFVVGGL